MTLGTAPSKDPGAVPLYVDLTSDLSPRHTPFAGEGARFLAPAARLLELGIRDMRALAQD